MIRKLIFCAVLASCTPAQAQQTQSPECVDPVAAHGADSTGTNDASTAITASIADAVTANVPLCIHGGKYLIANQIHLTSADNNLTIQADSGAHFILQAGGSNGSIIRGDSGVTGVTLDGGEYDGAQSSQPSNNPGNLIDFPNANFITIRNIYLHDTYGYGIRTLGTNNMVEHNRISNSLGEGIFAGPYGAPAYDIRIRDNYIDRSMVPMQLGSGGFDIDAQGAAPGYDFFATDISRNTLLVPGDLPSQTGAPNDASNGGIQLLGYSGVTNVQRGATIENNRIFGGGEAIATSSLVGGSISGNTAAYFSHACVEANGDLSTTVSTNSCVSAIASVGIYEDNGASNSPITGNAVTLTMPTANTTATAASTTNIITVSSTTGIVPSGGQGVIGTGVPGNTLVVSVSGLNVTVSQVVNIANGAALTFSSYVVKGIYCFTSSCNASGNDVAITGGHGAGLYALNPPGTTLISSNNIHGSFDYGAETSNPIDVAVLNNHINGSNTQAVIFFDFGAGPGTYFYSAIGNTLKPAAGGNIQEAYSNYTPTVTGSAFKSNVSSTGTLADHASTGASFSE